MSWTSLGLVWVVFAALAGAVIGYKLAQAVEIDSPAVERGVIAFVLVTLGLLWVQGQVEAERLTAVGVQAVRGWQVCQTDAEESLDSLEARLRRTLLLDELWEADR